MKTTCSPSWAASQLQQRGLVSIHTTARTSQILGSTVKHLSLLILKDVFPMVWRISTHSECHCCGNQSFFKTHPTNCWPLEYWRLWTPIEVAPSSQMGNPYLSYVGQEWLKLGKNATPWSTDLNHVHLENTLYRWCPSDYNRGPFGGSNCTLSI